MKERRCPRIDRDIELFSAIAKTRRKKEENIADEALKISIRCEREFTILGRMAMKPAVTYPTQVDLRAS